MESRPLSGLIAPAREGKGWNVLGQTITLKVGGEDTSGDYSVIQQIAPPLESPPLYVHRLKDELLHVLEGE